MRHIVVTIDGPAGTGKSTVAKGVAKKLGYVYLDTGALYRAAALAIDESGCEAVDDEGCARVVQGTDIEITPENRIMVNGRDVTLEIRTSHISALASKIAVHPAVRKALLDLQRSFRDKSSLVAEGRDTGSVVFPDADIKFYLDASQEERARRRYEELVAKGHDVSFEQVFREQTERDQRDMNREAAPLVIPEHAIVVDTTHLDSEEVTTEVLHAVQEHLAD